MAGILSTALVIGWLIVVTWLSRKVTAGVSGQKIRFLSRTVIAALALPLPLADEILAIPEFKKICQEKGLTVAVDSARIRGKTVRVSAEPLNARMTGIAVPVTFSRLIYRDTATHEELASYSRYVAHSGRLLRTLSNGNDVSPLLVQPSSCAPPNVGNMPSQFGFSLVE